MKQINIGLYHFATYRRGEAQWYDVQFNECTRLGYVAVHHDSKMYLYKGLSRKDIKSFKTGVRQAWANELSNGARLTGRFPCYYVE